MKFLLIILLLIQQALASNYTVEFIGSATDGQKEKVTLALKEAHEKIRSSDFSYEVLNFKQPDKSLRFYQATMNNEEVLKVLISSKWDHKVAFYSKCLSKARAYVEKGPTVNLNWCLIKNDQLWSIGNTLIHEQTHVFGFTHDYDRTALRPYSVPYGVGSIIENLMGGEAEIKRVYTPWYKRIFNWFR